MNIYVGNLSYQCTEEALRGAFEAYGTVTSVAIIKDKFSGQSRGFGFVEMADDTEGAAAVEGLNDTELLDRRLRVSKARPREDRGRDRRPDPGRRF